MKEQVFYGIEAYMARKKVEDCISSSFLVTTTSFLVASYILFGHKLHPFLSQTTSFLVTNYIFLGHQILIGQQLHIFRSSKVGTLASWRFWPRTQIISTRTRSKFDLVLPSSTSLNPLSLPLPLPLPITLIIPLPSPLPITSTRTHSKFDPEHASPRPHASLKPYLSSHTRTQILRDPNSQWLVMLSSRPEVTCFGPELTLVLTRADRGFDRESLQGGWVVS